MPAAALAAVFVLVLSSSAEAKRAHPSTRQAASSNGGDSRRAEAHKKKIPAAGSRAKAPKKARRFVHQRSDGAVGAVVVDRAAARVHQLFGPFLPVEPVDYPRPLCEANEVVLEAHVHEDDAETPEPEDVAEAMPEPEHSPLIEAARSFGSFLRPKSPHSTLRPEDVDLSELLSAGVLIPVEGVDSSRLRDSFLNSRGRHRKHLAIDIGAPTGTPVVAAADGEIVRLRREKRGGISLYQRDPTGNYLLFYCHLSRYAKGLKPGNRVSKGDVIAYVGKTGHVIGGSHLHFSITRMPEDDDNWKAGVAINPYLLFLAAVP
jgi:peptidoglycan LD-endopeptidase LytH